MRRIFTIFIFTLFCSFLFTGHAQKRVVLYEVFTSNTCGPCASASELLDSLMNNYQGSVAAIKYHVWWPSPGNDIMFLNDSAKIKQRHAFYGQPWSAPTFLVNGKEFPSYTEAIKQINRFLEVPSPFEMKTTYSITQGVDSVIQISCKIKALDDISGNLKLFVDVIEKFINDPKALGTNAEKEFHNVHRQLLPVDMPQSMTKGEEITLTAQWRIKNIYNINQLAAVALVQNLDTKEVLQATTPYTAENSEAAKITEVKGFDAELCSSSFSCIARILNKGKDTLSSANIHIRINGKDEQVFPWTGNLEYGSFVDVQIPEIPSSLSGPTQNNSFLIWLTDMNGLSNQSENYTGTFRTSSDFGQVLQLVIRTDSKPQEVTWNITDSQGSIVFSGGPFTNASTNNVIDLTMPKSDCYKLKIFDSGKDGINNGYVKVYEMKNGLRDKELLTLLTNKADSLFFYNFSVMNVTSGIEKTDISKTLKISPNPSNGRFTISGIENTGNAILRLYNASGTKVYESTEVTKVDLPNLDSGTYFLQITAPNFTGSQKVIISK